MMNMKLTVGQKLYASVMAIFLVFAVALIMFQQNREKQFKIEALNIRLQGYNEHMAESLDTMELIGFGAMNKYVAMHNMPGLRVTIINTKGEVIYDNKLSKPTHAANHLNRPEIRQALATGKGYTVDRKSNTLNHDYFYSATYYPQSKVIVRALRQQSYSFAKCRPTLYMVYSWSIARVDNCVVAIYSPTGQECRQATTLCI